MSVHIKDPLVIEIILETSITTPFFLSSCILTFLPTLMAWVRCPPSCETITVPFRSTERERNYSSAKGRGKSIIISIMGGWHVIKPSSKSIEVQHSPKHRSRLHMQEKEPCDEVAWTAAIHSNFIWGNLIPATGEIHGMHWRCTFVCSEPACCDLAHL